MQVDEVGAVFGHRPVPRILLMLPDFDAPRGGRPNASRSDFGRRGSANTPTAAPLKKSAPEGADYRATKMPPRWDAAFRTCRSRRPGRTVPPRRLDPAWYTPIPHRHHRSADRQAAEN